MYIYLYVCVYMHVCIYIYIYIYIYICVYVCGQPRVCGQDKYSQQALRNCPDKFLRLSSQESSNHIHVLVCPVRAQQSRVFVIGGYIIYLFKNLYNSHFPKNALLFHHQQKIPTLDPLLLSTRHISLGWKTVSKPARIHSFPTVQVGGSCSPSCNCNILQVCEPQMMLASATKRFCTKENYVGVWWLTAENCTKNTSSTVLDCHCSNIYIGGNRNYGDD